MIATMPRGPKGQKRPADVIGNAVQVMKIATGEEAKDWLLEKRMNCLGYMARDSGHRRVPEPPKKDDRENGVHAALPRAQAAPLTALSRALKKRGTGGRVRGLASDALGCHLDTALSSVIM